jgi:predicted exporter
VYDNDSVHSSPEKLIAYADSLTTFLEKNYSGYIRGIRYKVSDSEMYSIYDLFYSNFPVFLEESDYLRLDSLTESKQIREHLHKDLQALMMPGSFTMKKFILGDPAGFMPLVLNKLKRLKVDDNYITYNGCIFSSDMKNLMLFIVPFYPVNETSNNARLLKAIDRQTNKLSEGSSVRARYFGAVAVAVGNANQLKKDSILTLSLAGLVIVVFISIFFRKRFAWLVIFLPVVFGGVFAMAILGFIKPDLSALALAAGSVVFGIALNYSMHIYSHFQHTRSVRTVISDLSTPLTIGSFTTIAAFLCLLLTKSEALRDFGVFSALTLIGTILFSLIVMPHLLHCKKHIPFQVKQPGGSKKLPDTSYQSINYLYYFF